MPLYVLLIGSPEEIPFEFQYLLDLYWSVGRLHFDTPDEYRQYAESVVAYETATVLPHKKHAAIFTVKNDGDRATGLLHNQVAEPIVKGSEGVRTLPDSKVSSSLRCWRKTPPRSVLRSCSPDRKTAGLRRFCSPDRTE